MENEVHLEPLHAAYLARIAGPGWRFGEPYEIMVVVVRVVPRWVRWVIVCLLWLVPKNVVEIRGLDKRPTKEQWQGLEKALIVSGVNAIEFDRIRNGVKQRKRRVLRREKA